MGKYQGLYPIIHISAHGTEEGIILSSGGIVSWQNLKNILSPINEALNGGLLICMSSCQGFSACRMAMAEEEGRPPFYAIVGNTSTPLWSDTAIAYAAFYHLISKGCILINAVNAMKEASGDNNFLSILGTEARGAYLDNIKKERLSNLNQVLDEERRKSCQINCTPPPILPPTI